MKTNPHPSVKAAVEFITPETAQDLLGSNVQHQRSISKTNLTKIESDLLNDRFKLNGEPIIVGSSGKLLDGQHRLCACLNTRKSFWSVVVRGIDEEFFHIINIGKTRSLADVLKIAGEVNCSNLACALVRVVQYIRDPSTVGMGTHSPVSASEAMDTLAMMPRIRDSVAANCFIYSGEIISCGRIAWLHCLAHEECPNEAPEFFTKLQTGEGLSSDNPIYQLRVRMMADKQSNAKLQTREVLALLIKTWNAYIKGEKMKLLRWGHDEAFPVAVFKPGK